jgi:glycosyltransferase involved in cell wall biosynthesis
MKNGISVLINTFNEEKNIQNCLESVKWADEIILVDMYSDDETVNIAKKYTDKIYFFEKCGYADPARNFALEKASCNWILVVDADELVPIALKNRLLKIAENDLADVVLIPRMNFVFGHLFKFTGSGPLQDAQLRFFKKGYMAFSPAIHQIYNINNDARIFKIDKENESFIHFAYVSVEQWIEKMDRYSTIEANNVFNDIKTNITFKGLFIKSLKNFIKKYFIQKGYKEGEFGFLWILLELAYFNISYIKLKLMEKFDTLNPEEKIRDEYQQITKKILDEYNKS